MVQNTENVHNGKQMNNYIKSLASFLFKKINNYQNDPKVRKEKPMLWPSGLYITEQKLEEWVKEHDDHSL